MQDSTLGFWLKQVKYLLPFCAPIGLVVVAFLQLYLVHTHSLVPWKGGGFGMFATVDAPAARFLRCYLITSAGEIPLRVPEDLKTLAGEVRYMPTSERLTLLASQLGQTAGKIEHQGVRIELWRYGFDAGNRQIKAAKILETTVRQETNRPR